LSNPDVELGQAIKAVGEKLNADRSKIRVTVYCLFAEQFGKLLPFS
jgi:hypothetical protein